MPVTLRVHQFGTQLRPDETPHGTKMIKSTPKVLTNSGIVGEGNREQLKTNFHEQQKEQDTVNTIFTREVLLTLSRQGMSFVRAYQILAIIQGNVETITKMKTVFHF